MFFVKKIFLTLFLLVFCLQLWGQGQLFGFLFRPVVSVETGYTGLLPESDSPYRDRLDVFRAKAGLVIPIKSKLGVNLDLTELLKVRKFKDLLKVTKVKAYQIFWNCNLRYLQTQWTSADSSRFFPTGQSKFDSYGLSTGITGLHLLSTKFNFLFYSANISIAESGKSLSKINPGFNLLGGYAKMANLRTLWYVAGFAGYNNGQIVASPVVGVDTRIGNIVRLNITLPVQVRLGIKFNKTHRLDLYTNYNGISSGFVNPELDDNRHAYSISQLRSGAAWVIKMNKQSKLIVEGGWAAARRLNFRGLDQRYSKPPVKDAPYCNISFFYTFHKSFFDSGMGDMLGF